MGSALKNLITIVSYRTFTRWVAGAERPKTKPASTRKPGRPRTAEDIRELVAKIASENGWGYTRVLGELRKLGIRNVSRHGVLSVMSLTEVTVVQTGVHARAALATARQKIRPA